jgi:mRNA-degrading endonuclease YafQ of YafQ-DinJ toxin-antitoxin module
METFKAFIGQLTCTISVVFAIIFTNTSSLCKINLTFQNIEVMDNGAASKSLCRAVCHPEMRTDKLYKVLLILSHSGTIQQANCECASGGGPQASCKHVTAFAYSLQDFVSKFLDDEGAIACTETLQQWNIPKPLKIKSVPTYDMHFEKPKVINPNPRVIKGKHPSEYELDKICDSDRKHAKTFLQDLKSLEEEGEQIVFLHILDENNPVVSRHQTAPISSFIEDFYKKLQDLKVSRGSLEEKTRQVLDLLVMDENRRKRIEEDTRDQAASWTWRKVRECRVTASICHRAITFTGKTSGENLVKTIINPKQFSTAATVFGKENEVKAIERYVLEKSQIGPKIVVRPCGFFIHPENGFLGATPDGIVGGDGGQEYILEVKCPSSCSTLTVEQAAKKNTYPLKRVPGSGSYQLKKSHQYYNQVQMQLYCCPFATYCDFVIFHVGNGYLHVERIERDPAWERDKIPKI